MTEQERKEYGDSLRKELSMLDSRILESLSNLQPLLQVLRIMARAGSRSQNKVEDAIKAVAEDAAMTPFDRCKFMIDRLLKELETAQRKAEPDRSAPGTLTMDRRRAVWDAIWQAIKNAHNDHPDSVLGTDIADIVTENVLGLIYGGTVNILTNDTAGGDAVQAINNWQAPPRREQLRNLIGNGTTGLTMPFPKLLDAIEAIYFRS